MQLNKKRNWMLCIFLFLFLCACQKPEEIVFVDSTTDISNKESIQTEITIDNTSYGSEQSVEYEAFSEEEISDITVFVHVCGAVKNPGVYELDEDSRVIDSVEAAGGALDNAALEAINLASILSDGAKIWIPTKEEALEMELSTDNNSDTNNSKEKNSKININTADSTLLCSLPGIGETRAQSIIAYREKYGVFESIEEIMQVSGIKENSFQKIKDYITVY